MGTIVHVYRSAAFDDASNGGISSNHSALTVVNAEGPFEPSPSRPAVILRKGPLGTVHIVPSVKDENGVWGYDRTKQFMSGGNFAATSDGRFHDAVKRVSGSSIYGAIAIHDRWEG